MISRSELLIPLSASNPSQTDDCWRLFFRPSRSADSTGTSISIAQAPQGWQLTSVQRPIPDRRTCISMGWVDATQISTITTHASRVVGSAPWFDWNPSLFVFVVLGYVEEKRLLVPPPQGAPPSSGGGGGGQGAFAQAKSRLEGYKGRIQIHRERAALGRAAQGRRGSAPPSPGMRSPGLNGPRSPGMGGGMRR